MSTDLTRKTMENYLRVLVDRGKYATYFSDDVTFTLMGAGQRVQGRAAVEQFIRYLHEQAFDAEPVVKTVVADGSRATLEADFVGTHINEFMGVAPSHRHVNVPYAVVYDLVDDKITALRAYMPMDSLMQQLNVTAASDVAST